MSFFSGKCVSAQGINMSFFFSGKRVSARVMERQDWSLSREWSSVHSPSFLAALHLYSPPFAIQIFYIIIACFMFFGNLFFDPFF